MLYDIERSSKNYSEMTNAINNCLGGKISLAVAGLSFGSNLSCSFNKSTKQIDIYEYAEKMVIRKMYALNIKPYVLESLRDYIPVDVWDEINATDNANPSSTARLDKNHIKSLYKKYGTKVEQRNMVIVDAITKHITSGSASDYFYADDINGVHRKFFRLDENMYDHVKGSTKGKMYFYYALGHLTDNAVVEMKFCGKGDADGDWKLRGCNSNEGVVGCLKDRYLAIKLRNVNNYPDKKMYVTGFGVKVKNKIKAISKGTEVGFNWTTTGDSWYSAGLIHDDVKCVYTKDKINNF